MDVIYFTIHRLEMPAKTMLLKEGDISKKWFIIEKGCIRAWFNNAGKDQSLQFFFENQAVASMESFRKKMPSPVSLETIEPSILWYVNKKEADHILGELLKISAWREQFINAIFERTYNYMKQSFSFIKDSPEQRFLNLLLEKPEFIHWVPQHYIASYLGVSSVHLSRIKGRLNKKQNGVS